jgi:hypothetical protein
MAIFIFLKGVHSMQLADYLDQEISMLIPLISKTQFQRVKIRGVEAGGIWIESQTLTNVTLASLALQTAPKSLAFFFPYSAITFGFVGIEGPGLNEAAFGL